MKLWAKSGFRALGWTPALLALAVGGLLSGSPKAQSDAGRYLIDSYDWDDDAFEDGSSSEPMAVDFWAEQE